MDSFINTFHIDWKTIIAQVINFAVILFVLHFLALKPLRKIMKERSEKITGGLNDAKKNKELLEQTQKEYDDILSKARTEAHTIFQDGKKEALEKKKLMIEDASAEVESMIASGKKTLEAEKEKMINEAKAEIVSLVVKATEKILETTDDESFNKKTLETIKKM